MTRQMPGSNHVCNRGIFYAASTHLYHNAPAHLGQECKDNGRRVEYTPHAQSRFGRSGIQSYPKARGGQRCVLYRRRLHPRTHQHASCRHRHDHRRDRRHYGGGVARTDSGL